MGKYLKEDVEKSFNDAGYKLINEYKSYSFPLFVKDKYGYIGISSWSAFSKGSTPSRFHIKNPYTIDNIRLWINTNAPEYTLLSVKYEGNKNHLSFKCPKNHEFYMVWNEFKRGSRCPYCCNKKVLIGFNDMATTSSWMMKYFTDKNDAYKYTNQSSQKVSVTCPDCGCIKKINISKIYCRKSIACTCGDGISYPEKFIISLLNQLNIKYIKEYKSNWSDNKKYDFYLKKYNTIIECNGEQHYINERTFKNRSLKEEQENDKMKKQLALNNGIDKYIILDCRKSDLKWIENSILNSELNNMFDLSKVSWVRCEEFALGNRVKEICDYWNDKKDWETTIDIANKFNLSKKTVRKYLKQGCKLGWCDYNPIEESKKSYMKAIQSTSKPIEVFKNGKSLGIFKSCADLERQSKKIFGIKLYHDRVSIVCKGKQKSYNGFEFRYTDDTLN